MKLKKTHRILKFKQKDWMKTYIDFNTQKRKEATNEADKNYFKLLKNACCLWKNNGKYEKKNKNNSCKKF